MHRVSSCQQHQALFLQGPLSAALLSERRYAVVIEVDVRAAVLDLLLILLTFHAALYSDCKMLMPHNETVSTVCFTFGTAGRYEAGNDCGWLAEYCVACLESSVGIHGLLQARCAVFQSVESLSESVVVNERDARSAVRHSNGPWLHDEGHAKGDAIVLCRRSEVRWWTCSIRVGNG